MNVLIANFGPGNYLWPQCQERHTVATIEDERLRPYFLAGDRAGYVRFCVEKLKTERGGTPTRAVASRWFNIGLTIAHTVSDLWIHREGDYLWWTITKPDPADVELQPAHKPEYQGHQVYAIHKPAHPWKNANKTGAWLNWGAIHPKAKDFLFTESTLVKFSEKNAEYVRALIEGADLSQWHQLPEWQSKLATARHAPARMLDQIEMAAIGMANTAIDTVNHSNGQLVERRVKIKELGFDDEADFQQYIRMLIEGQDGHCAISGLPLQYPATYDDKEMLASLDRIDSNGHYARDNLQVVCRFINRWKSDDDVTNFARLLAVIRATAIQ